MDEFEFSNLLIIHAALTQPEHLILEEVKYEIKILL